MTRFTQIYFQLMMGLALLPGCSVEQATPGNQSAAGSAHAMASPLRLIVVDDPEVGPVAQREWLARTGQRLEVERFASEELLASNACPEADVIYFPGRLLGSLAERGWLRPLPAFASRDEFAEGDLSVNDIMPLIRRRAIKWGSRTMALPSTERVLILGFRRDVLELLNADVPDTWDDLSAAIAAYSAMKSTDTAEVADLPEFAFAQPNTPDSIAFGFLARAVSYAKTSSRYSMLFDLTTATPQVDQPPFVRALEEMRADRKHASPTAELDPVMAFEHLLAGRVAFAIGWLGSEIEDELPQLPIEFALLPGASDEFAGNWTARDKPQRVTLLGCQSRYLGVLKNTRKQRSAWSLAVRLTGVEWGQLIGQASIGNAPVRASQLAGAYGWLGGTVAESARSATSAALSLQDAAFVPRIPGGPEYATKLSSALAQEEETASTALGQLAEDWEAITTQYPQQVEAYYRSLGLEP